MTDSPDAISSAKKFALALTTNTKLLNAFIGIERKLAKTVPQTFEIDVIDNFLSDQGYNCTMNQVEKYGMPILGNLTHWSGTYHTQISPPKGTDWMDGPTVVIHPDGTVSINDIKQPKVTFNMLNLKFSQNNLIFYMASPGAFEDAGTEKPPSSPKGNSHPRVKAFFGDYSGMKITGVATAKPRTTPKKKSKSAHSFIGTFHVVEKYLNQAILVYQVYHVIKRGAHYLEQRNSAKSKLDSGELDSQDISEQSQLYSEAENEISNAGGDLHEGMTYLSQSQVDVYTEQHLQIGDVRAANPDLDYQQAADELRDNQSLELETEQISDEETLSTDISGDTLADTAADLGETGLETLSPEALDILGASVGDLTADTFLEEALVLVCFA